MEKGFNRRIFTAGLFLGEILSMIRRLPTMVGALRNKEISRAFLEKIFVVVTAVNGCTYCAWFHARAAMSSGINPEELRDTVNLKGLKAPNSNVAFEAIFFILHAPILLSLRPFMEGIISNHAAP